MLQRASIMCTVLQRVLPVILRVHVLPVLRLLLLRLLVSDRWLRVVGCWEQSAAPAATAAPPSPAADLYLLNSKLNPIQY